MSKEETLIMKGIAILMMLFLHLFSSLDNLSNMQIYLFCDSTPLLFYLSRMSNPVSVFLILGGYGMYYVWRKGDRHRYSRIAKLYLHFWATMFVFLAIGSIIHPDKYPGPTGNLILNLIGIKWDINAACWFLLPYSCLSLIAPYLFKICNNFRTIYVILVFCLIGLSTSWGISRYGEEYLKQNLPVYIPYLVVHLSFPFMLGAITCKCQVIPQFKYTLDKFLKFIKIINTNYFVFAILCLLGLCRCLIDTSAVHTFYIYICLLLFLYIKRWKWVDTILKELGRKSMDMWMIHAWFCYSLFHSWLYNFKYPIIIYIILITASYLCSIVLYKILVVPEKAIGKIFDKR